MATHKSGVNFRKLISDLADMYPFDTDEVILTELVANSLDSKATRICIDFSKENHSLVVEDDGKGMTARQFAAYHDFAAELKSKGTGIGFAGVGAKISFNIADTVITETRSRSFSGGSNWHIDDKGQLSWDEIHCAHLSGPGTRVEVLFRPEAQISWSSPNDLVEIIRRHYLPLTDPVFLHLYDSLKTYSESLRFVVNGKEIEPTSIAGAFGLDKVKHFVPKVRSKRIGLGVLGLASTDYPLGHERCGVAICTYGKVIKSELFGQFPGSVGPKVFGMVEVPGLVKFLTTSKADFVRRGKAKDFERIYSPLRDAFRDWLREVGADTLEVSTSDETRKLEREIQRLAAQIPELAEFFGYLPSAQKTTLFAPHEEGLAFAEADVSGVKAGPSIDQDSPAGGEAEPGADGQETRTSLRDTGSGNTKANPISRKSRRGLKISFANAPERDDLAWVEGLTVFINSGHPARGRVRGNALALTLLNMTAIGLAIQRFLQESERPDHTFADRMVKVWGGK